MSPDSGSASLIATLGSTATISCLNNGSIVRASPFTRTSMRPDPVTNAQSTRKRDGPGAAPPGRTPLLRHSNDFVRLRINAAEFALLNEQSLTDGICIGPQPRSQDLIDDNGLLARLRIAGIESSAPDDWYP